MRSRARKDAEMRTRVRCVDSDGGGDGGGGGGSDGGGGSGDGGSGGGGGGTSKRNETGGLVNGRRLDDRPRAAACSSLFIGALIESQKRERGTKTSERTRKSARARFSTVQTAHARKMRTHANAKSRVYTLAAHAMAVFRPTVASCFVSLASFAQSSDLQRHASGRRLLASAQPRARGHLPSASLFIVCILKRCTQQLSARLALN